MIRPTSHRILIQPDAQPETDGAILLPQHREYVATSGTVIAMGPRGSRLRYEARQRALQDAAALVYQPHLMTGFADEQVRVLRDGLRKAGEDILKLVGSADPEHDVTVGDRVAFDAESGLRLIQDGVEYLILDEDDVVVIVDEKESAA